MNEWMNEWINQATKQSSNQAIKQPSNQSSNQAINERMNLCLSVFLFCLQAAMAAGGAARATVHQEAMAEAQSGSLIAKRLFVSIVSMQSIYASEVFCAFLPTLLEKTDRHVSITDISTSTFCSSLVGHPKNEQAKRYRERMHGSQDTIPWKVLIALCNIVKP